MLGDAYDQQGIEGAEVFQVQKATVEGAEKKESLAHMESGQWEMETALEQEVLQDGLFVGMEQKVVGME